jgi:hypothetical protein
LRGHSEDVVARRKILLLGLLLGALQACATKSAPRAAAPRRSSATVAPVRLAVLPSDPLLFADVATALDRHLAQARPSGVGPMVRGKVSMEVAQLTLECVSPTDECYAQVGRFLQVDRLLWGSIARGPQAAGVRVTVVFLDVARGAPIARAEATFPASEDAIGGLQKLVDQATSGAGGAGAPIKAKPASPSPSSSPSSPYAPMSLLERMP